MLQKLKHLRTPLGRRRLRNQVLARVLSPLTRLLELHRRTSGARTRIVVVTGSLGKTTTTAALTTLLENGRQPPDANILGQAALLLLRCWPWRPYAVVEAGIDRSGQMDRFASLLRPDIAVVTAVASEHSRSFGTLERTRDEKARSLLGLRPGGVAVLNNDDPLVRSMASTTDARIVTFGFAAGSDARGLDWRLDWPRGSVLRAEVGGRVVEVRTRLLGRQLSYPLLAALAVASVEGLDPARAAAALAALRPQPHRMELHALPDGSWLIDDSLKSIVETVDSALDLLAEIPGRRLVVLGDVDEPVGSQGPIYRRLGARLAGIAEHIVVLGNCRRPYAAGAARAGMRRDAIVDAGHDLDRARSELDKVRRPGDVILVKGRMQQRLGRLALELAGRRVRCRIQECRLNELTCSRCAMLERPWAG